VSDSTTCPNCSATLPAGAAFCTSCGTRTPEAPDAAAAPAGEATRIDNPGLTDATQTYSPPPTSPWQPADGPSAPPAPPSWEAPPSAPTAAPAWQSPAPATWSPPPGQQPQAPAWQQAPPGAAPPKAWGTAPPGPPQWGAAPAAPATTATKGGSVLGGLIALLGGIITLIGLFTAWIGTNVNDETTTGWALASGDEGLKSNDPYLILGLGIGALVLGVLLFTGAARIVVRLALIAVGIAVVATAVRDWTSIADLAKDLPSTVEITAQFGFYLTIAGGIVTAIAALMPGKKNVAA